MPILIKALVFLVLPLQLSGFDLIYFFCISNNKIILFYLIASTVEVFTVLISSFISSYCLKTLFTKTKSFKALEIKTSMVFFLLTVLFYRSYFLFFLIIDLQFLIPSVIVQIFNSTAELVFPRGIPTKDAKAEIEANPVTSEARISKCPVYLNLYKPFCSSYSSINFRLVL